jgi:hypothetical protein
MDVSDLDTKITLISEEALVQRLGEPKELLWM